MYHASGLKHLSPAELIPLLAQLPAGATLTMRPEELTVEQLAALAHALPPA
jgi:hypothetical protein